MNTSYWPIHTSSHLPNLAARLASNWDRLLAHLNTTTEPRVWQTSDRRWNGYDPISQLTIDQASADELRTWLEELHYRR
ncbi:hypothetical protein IQ254_08730 [Nodosilinea sp. LEGE 07088]|uniref:hypothetical protein n=1 Tax=Nodosilinea sp. LEGE 07088 TaxID=2777968 RepID=UPI00187FB6DD|nr:hypothetical protein [Nodosilinea sp. LEGE 07088]MBE9137291.1 hypothetical protein [Nodosilinea sp. LEGE 07088]